MTIAGSDPSGGAGIQADIKTITAHKQYAMSVVTALTAQNTTGVYGVLEVSAEFVAQQLDCIFTDIYPDAVKIGMVSSEEIIQVIVAKLQQYSAKNIVVDPVMVATSGGKLLRNQALDAMVTQLLPIAQIITPNIPEAEALSHMEIHTKRDMVEAAHKISALFSGDIVLKGGHLTDSADDLILSGGKVIWLPGSKVENPNTHGTGCTLSSAIACGLASNLTTLRSIYAAKSYITGALNWGLNLGKGNGPLNHMYTL